MDILTLPFISLKDDGVDLWFIQNKQKKKKFEKKLVMKSAML